jgi:hypothetical protein
VGAVYGVDGGEHAHWRNASVLWHHHRHLLLSAQFDRRVRTDTHFSRQLTNPATHP